MPNVIEIPTKALTAGPTTLSSTQVTPMLYGVYGLSRGSVTTNVLGGVWPAGAYGGSRPVFDSAYSSQLRALGSLHIMPGEMPANADAALKNAIALIPTSLATFTNVNTSGGPFTTSAPPINTPFTDPWITLNSSYVTAAVTGKATWFMIACRAWTNVASNTFYHMIIGTIGKTGSGSDLEIANDDVVSGKLYRISGLKLSLPTSFEYK